MNLTATGESRINGYLFVLERALMWHLAATTLWGFFAGLIVFVGYVTAIGFFAIAILKPIFPQNVGFQFVRGVPVGLGAHFPLSPDADLRGGYWIVPFAVFCGLAIFAVTHRGARRYLAWWRARRVS